MAEQLTPIIHIGEGLLRGRIVPFQETPFEIDKTYCVFEGIPYAEPPLRELRFKDPRPAKCWTGIFNAVNERNVCPSSWAGPSILDEDCLYLNIYTPELKPKSQYGVLVLVNDTATVPQNVNPEAFLRHGIVLVTVTFRTGILGFLSLESQNIPGNAGLKDIVMALKWIHTNISKFGGNRDNVSVMGVGVGGPCYAHLLTMSPLTKGLFQKLILLSGCGVIPWREYKSNLGLLQERLGCMEDGDIYKKLSVLAIEKLMEIFSGTEIYFSPVVENSGIKESFLVENPVELLQKGSFTSIPTIFGVSSNEVKLSQKFLSPIEVNTSNSDFFTPREFKLRLGSRLSREVGKQIKQFYYGDENPSEELREQHSKLVTDVNVLLGIADTIKLLRKTQTAVWLLSFEIDGELTAIFDYLKSPSGVDIMPYFTNFVKIGSASEVDKLLWRPITKKDSNYLEVTRDGVKLKTGLKKKTLDFWNELKTNIEKEKK